MVRYGRLWYVMVRYGTIWYDMVRYGTLWYDMVIWYVTVRYGTLWYDMECYGTLWYELARFDSVRFILTIKYGIILIDRAALRGIHSAALRYICERPSRPSLLLNNYQGPATEDDGDCRRSHQCVTIATTAANAWAWPRHVLSHFTPGHGLGESNAERDA